MNARIVKAGMFGLLISALAFQLTCFSRDVDTTSLGWCKPGFSDICYTGPEGSLGMGVCKSGQEYCWEEGGKTYKACRNQVLPSSEICNGLDDDCDGVVDNNGACSGEDLTRLQDQIGPTLGIYEDDRIGPLFLAKQVKGPLYSCGASTSMECVSAFLSEFGGVYGIVDPTNQVDLEDTELGIVKGRQKHRGVRVPDGSIAFYLTNDPTDNAILSIVNSFYPLRASLEVAPTIKPEDLVLDEETGPVTGTPELLVLVPLGNDTRRNPIELQEPQLSWRVAGEETVTYYSAVTGDKLASESNVHLALYREIKHGGKTYNEKNPPPAGNDIEVIWSLLGDYYDFMAEADALKLVAGKAATFKVDVTNSRNCCLPNACSSAFIDASNEIIICEDTLKSGGKSLTDAVIHEASHSVFLGTVKESGKGDAGDAMDESLPIFSALFYGCVKNGVCDWTYQVDKYIFDIKNGNVCIGDKSNKCSETFHYKTDKKMYPGAGAHGESRFIVRALYLTYAWMVRDSGRTVEEATLAFKWLMYQALLGHLAGASNFKELPSAFRSACDQLSSPNWSGPIKLSTPDCVAVFAGFWKVDLMDLAIKIDETTELCNGIDDNGDIPKDNCTQVNESCSLKDTLTDDTLNKIGDYNGKACPMVCKKGEWGYYYNDVKRSFPGKPEVCNYIDDNCDGLVDEANGKEFGLRVDYGPDRDHDGYPSVSRIEKVCEGDNALILQGLPQGSRFDDQVKDYLKINPDLSNVDCDDNDPNVHPGPNAVEVCSNGIDDDCDGSTDEGCPCTYPADSPRACKAQQAVNPECPDGVQYCQSSGTWSDCIAPDDTNVVGGPCITGNLGICSAGTWGCKGKSIVCVQTNVQLAKDVPCNGLDDDCDGSTDEDDDALLGTACSPAKDSLGQVLLGICASGQYGCRNNQLTCLPLTLPGQVPETCNTLDDDCDGTADELSDITKNTGTLCVTGFNGICDVGHVGCSGGTLTCNADVTPGSRSETCNGLDDDCDGKIDNGASCPSGQVCANGACATVQDSLIQLPPVVIDNLIHVGGDCDFDSGGVNITVKVTLTYSGACVLAEVYLDMIEEHSDWTEGTKTVYVNGCAGSAITGLVSSATQTFKANAQNCNDWHDYQPAGDLIASLHCMGDTEAEDVCGGQIGTDSGCYVWFKPITVKIVP